MDIEYVTKLIELISESKVDEIEIEEDGKKIRVAKLPQAAPSPQQAVYNVPAPVAPQPAQLVPAAQEPSAPPPTAAPSTKLQEIRSPIVGTFYQSPAPDAAPFVQVGSTIAKGAVLCIVEAMKLMNEIESDMSGKIVQIMVENGQPVEYDQVLFLVEPS